MNAEKHLSVVDLRASLPSYFQKDLPLRFQRELDQEQKSSSVPDSLPFIPPHTKQKLNVRYMSQDDLFFFDKVTNSRI